MAVEPQIKNQTSSKKEFESLLNEDFKDRKLKENQIKRYSRILPWSKRGKSIDPTKMEKS